MSLTGTAPSRGLVAALIHALKASSLYADPFITTTSYGQAEGDQAVQFVGSVGLTGDAVSGRYSDARWLADRKVLAEANRLVESGRAAAMQLRRQAREAAAALQTRHQDAATSAAEAAEAPADARAQERPQVAQATGGAAVASGSTR